MNDSRNPENYRHILVRDLIKILGRGPGSFEIKPLPQDASMRRYYRVTGPEFSLNSSGENSLVIMALADPNPKGRSEEITASGGNAGGAERREPIEEDLDYVNVLRHFEKVGVPVPKLYEYNVQHGFLYLEDLGNDLLESYQAGLDPESRKKVYLDAIGNIAVIHQDATALKNPKFVGFNRGFDERLLYLELMHYVEYGIEARKRVKVNESELEVIQLHMKKIAAELAAEPRVVVHRDFQSRNILIKNGNLRIIDFQDALMGTRQYDLVSFLRDSYVVLDWDTIHSCIDRYCDLVEDRSGDKIDRDRFIRVFHLQTLQRKIKDTGRFDYIDIVKKNPNFLKYIPNSLRYVREAFDAAPEHKPMQDMLAKYTPEIAG